MESDLVIEPMTPYVIINKAETLALTVKESVKGSLIGDFVDPQNVCQLFFIQKASSPKAYKLVHLLTDKVMTLKSSYIALDEDTNQISQQFLLVHNGYISPYFWLKFVEYESKTLSLDKKLQALPFQSSDQRQMFKLQKNEANNVFKRSCLIENQFSQKIFESLFNKNGKFKKVVQSKLTKRFGQRWVWERQGVGYILKNLLSEGCLEVDKDQKIEVNKQTGQMSQLWLPEALGKVYRIRSAFYPNTFLSVKNSSLRDDQEIILSHQVNQSSYWIINGSLP